MALCNNINNIYNCEQPILNTTNLNNTLNAINTHTLTYNNDIILLSQKQNDITPLIETNISNINSSISLINTLLIPINSSITTLNERINESDDYNNILNASILNANTSLQLLNNYNEKVNASITNVSNLLNSYNTISSTINTSFINISTQLSITNASILQTYINITEINSLITNVSTIVSNINTSIIQTYDNVSHINASITTILKNYEQYNITLSSNNIWTGNNTFNNVLNVSIINTINDNTALILGGSKTSFVQTNASLIANKGIILSDNQYITSNHTYSTLPNVSQIGYFNNTFNSDLINAFIDENNLNYTVYYPSLGTYDPLTTNMGYVPSSTLYQPGIYIASILCYYKLLETDTNALFHITVSLAHSNDINIRNDNASSNIVSFSNNIYPNGTLNYNGDNTITPHQHHIYTPMITFNITTPKYIYSVLNIVSHTGLSGNQGGIYANISTSYIIKVG